MTVWLRLAYPLRIQIWLTESKHYFHIFTQVCVRDYIHKMVYKYVWIKHYSVVTFIIEIKKAITVTSFDDCLKICQIILQDLKNLHKITNYILSYIKSISLCTPTIFDRLYSTEIIQLHYQCIFQTSLFLNIASSFWLSAKDLCVFLYTFYSFSHRYMEPTL